MDYVTLLECVLISTDYKPDSEILKNKTMKN